MERNLNEFRALFPITKESIYFNHASTGPMSMPARRAIEECIKVYQSQAEFDFDRYFGRLKEARSRIAKLINATPDEITFTHSTSEGVYIALINLPLKDGDKILVMKEVFPTVQYIVDYNLPGLEKKYVEFGGRDPIEVVKRNFDKKVRAVVIDWVQFFTGEVIDLNRLSKFLKEKGIYLVVDGIQGISAIEFNCLQTEVDFFACGAAKWLFGPSGAGFLYVNKKNFKFLRKLHTGWLGADWHCWENFDFKQQKPLFTNARMFEQGTRNIIGISAFSENVKILLQFGLKNVRKQISTVKEKLKVCAKELGFEILTPEIGLQSGIITVRPRKNTHGYYDRLTKRRVIVSLRNNALRFSPHFYNTLEEVAEIRRIMQVTP